MTILRRKLNEIFMKVQLGSTCIYIKRLQNLYHDSDFEEFLTEFLKCFNMMLIVKNEPDPYRDKLLIFTSKFCTSLKNATNDSEQLCPFLKEIFLHLFKEYHPDIISTLRVCQFIKLLLKEIGEQESFLDEDICIKIRDMMLERIDDIKPKVRIQAVEVLQRLQNPADNNDEIIKAFVEHINDDNWQVRKQIVQSIGVNIISIPVIVGRCLDVNDDVRLMSYEKLSKIPIRALKIAQRQFVLRSGFADKSSKIQNFIVKTLLPQWLSTYDGDYFQFIRVLKLDADENDFKQTTALIEKVLQTLFKNTEISTIMEALPLGREKLISCGEIQWEEILFWRYLQQFLRTQESENDYVEKILPELIFFCDYVTMVYKTKSQLKNDWEIVQHDHIMFELLKICHDYDYSDEVGRKTLMSLLTNTLTDGPALYDVTVLIIKMFEKLIPDTEERLSKFCEIIGEIQTPWAFETPNEDKIRKRDVKLAEFRCKLNIAEDKLEIAIEKEDFDKASELKKEIATINAKLAEISKEFEDSNLKRIPKTDTSTVCRCLDILTASLNNPIFKSLPELYRGFQYIFLPPLVNSRQPEVYWRALKLLGIFSNFDLKLAKESMKTFCSPLLAHKFRPVFGDQTTIIAIMCVTDMILVHGSDVFSEDDNMSNVSQRPANKRQILERTTIDETICNEPPPPSQELVMEILCELLDDTDDKIRETTANCLITLIMAGRVRSPLLFSKLLLKWFSPSTVKDVRLRQIIGRLFIDYVPESPYSLEVIEQAFVPTLQAIIDAPRSSPLADVDVDSVSRFLAALSQPGRHKYNVGLDAHKNIALILCQEICDQPNNKRSQIYLKTLLHLEPPEDEVTMDILRKQVDTMQELVKEKQSRRYVLKYAHKLNNDLSNNENTASATSMNNGTLPESTVTTVNTENLSATIETQKDDLVPRYSTLSIKRRKRPSKENGEQALHGIKPPTNVTDRLNQETEIGTNCIRIVMSETDSEYATEHDTEGNKKRPHHKQTNELLVQNEEAVFSQTSECDRPGEQEKNHINGKPEKELIVCLVRSEEIDKRYLETKNKKSSELNLIIQDKDKNEQPGNVTETQLTVQKRGNKKEKYSQKTTRHSDRIAEKRLQTVNKKRSRTARKNGKIISTENRTSKHDKEPQLQKVKQNNTDINNLKITIERNEEIEKLCLQKQHGNSKENNTNINNLKITIERNEEIEKLCLQKQDGNSKELQRRRKRTS